MAEFGLLRRCFTTAQDAITFRQPTASASSSSSRKSSSSSSSSHTPTLSVYSVDQLLSYSEDDTKESTFEVSAVALYGAYPSCGIRRYYLYSEWLRLMHAAAQVHVDGREAARK